MPEKKVFVSGCFDMLHSGHIRFLGKAAKYGDAYLVLGSDRTLIGLKGRAPVTTEKERKIHARSRPDVKRCIISRGTGIMDFVDELKRLKPDIFIVNEEGNTPAKTELCQRLGSGMSCYSAIRLKGYRRVPRQVCARNAKSRIGWIWPGDGWINHSFQNMARGRC